MQVGVIFPQTEIGSDPTAVREFAHAAEDLGYDYLAAYDHVLGVDPRAHRLWNPDLPDPYTFETSFHEVFVLFGYLAAVTRRIQLVTSILVLPQRQTALVAKQAAEIDILSGGRLTLGVGIGWNQAEYAGMGFDFHTRGRRVEQQVALLRRLWSEPLVDFDGEFERIEAAGINPLPGRRIPIWLGGGADRVLDRIGRIADGWLEGAVSRRSFTEGLAKIHASARATGRDPSAISASAGVIARGLAVRQQVERAHEFEALGATHFSLRTLTCGFTALDQHIAAMRGFKEAYDRSAARAGERA
jgi:probable F420-dependent oxidoreductase